MRILYHILVALGGLAALREVLLGTDELIYYSILIGSAIYLLKELLKRKF